MDLTKEAILQIQTTAQEAQTAKRIDLPGDGRTVYVQIGGEIKPYEVKPEVRTHTVRSLGDLIQFAKNANLAKKDPALDYQWQPVVWHGPGLVTIILNDRDRRDRVDFVLTHSAPYTCLVGLDQKVVPFQQRDLIRLLRFNLGVSEAQVAPLRKLAWFNNAQGSGEVGHGRDKMGREIRSEVTGDAALPEDFIVVAPVYVQSGERDTYDCRCKLEIDSVNQAFYFLPVPGEVEAMIDRAQASIRVRLEEGLADEGIPIYYGAP